VFPQGVGDGLSQRLGLRPGVRTEVGHERSVLRRMDDRA
jgi:hypothetical protein